MSETKKKPSAYAKLFKFFTSKAVRNVTITVLAVLSVVIMFLMDQQNSFRRDHLKALESNFVVNILDSIGWKRFNIRNSTWAIFGCALLVTLFLVMASTFSGVFVDKRASKNASRFKSEKSAKTFYGCTYYGVVILIAALIIFIAVMTGLFSDVFFTTACKDLLNLLLTLLICLGFMLIIPVAVFIVYSVYALIALIVRKAKNKNEEEETVDVIAEATDDAAPETEVAVEETETVTAEETAIDPASEEVKVVAEEISEPEVKVEEVKAEEVKAEEVKTEAATNEIAATAEPQNEAEKFFASMEGKQFISKSFIGKMHQTDKTIQGYYGELKNYMLSFKRVRSSISWNLDTFFIGRKAVAKIGFRGKTLVMFCALDPVEYANTKYYPKDVSGVKKYEATPMMIKVKSERDVKFAKELIDVMFKGLTPIEDFKPQKYNFARRTDKQLLENDLAKYI